MIRRRDSSGQLDYAQKDRAAKRSAAFLLLLCFLLPALILTYTFAQYGMAPFGDKSVMIMDMSGQYVEFFCGLKHFGTAGSPFFSWSKVMGSNFIGVFAYYLSSPLSVLTLLCPNNAMPIGLLFLTVLKIGLCGLTFGWFLKKTTRRCDLFTVLFSTFYAMMSYNVVYSMCIMWIDGVIWLPIVLLGVERLIREGKWGLLLGSLLAVFLSTYYIAYMVGAFTFLYFGYRIFVTRTRKPVLLVKFFGSALIAAALSAWLLLPTYYSLLQGKIGSSGYVPDVTHYYEWEDLLPKLFMGNYDNITGSGTPFLYCGIAVFMLFIAYFFIRGIPLKEKFAAGILTLLLLGSLYLRDLDLAWHMFQYPNWFPYRYTFVLSFFMVLTAYRSFCCLKQIRPAFMISFFAVFLLIGRLLERAGYRYIDEGSIQLTLWFLCVYILLLLVKRGVPVRAVSIAVAVAMFFTAFYELYRHSTYLLEGLDQGHRYEDYWEYRDYKKQAEALLAAAEAHDRNSGGNAFYRVGQNYVRSYNESIGLGYQSVAHYSSAFNKNMNAFLSYFGFAQGYIWNGYFGSTMVFDSLFAVKYVMNDPECGRNPKVVIGSKTANAFYEKVGAYGSGAIYCNPYALSSPCFLVSKAVLNEFTWQRNSVLSQNKLLNLMLGNQNQTAYFSEVTDRPDGGACFTQTAAEPEEGAGVVYTMEVLRSGALYGYFPQKKNGECDMRINGGPAVTIYRGETNGIHYLGSYTAGETVTVEIISKGGSYDAAENRLYLLDLEAFTRAAETLQSDEMALLEWGVGFLRGTVSAGPDQIMFTSLPYDPGWSVYIDGEPAETCSFADALLCFAVPEGDHEILLRYTAEGLRSGVMITFCGLIGLTFYAGRRRRQRAINPASVKRAD